MHYSKLFAEVTIVNILFYINDPNYHEVVYSIEQCIFQELDIAIKKMVLLVSITGTREFHPEYRELLVLPSFLLLHFLMNRIVNVHN